MTAEFQELLEFYQALALDKKKTNFLRAWRGKLRNRLFKIRFNKHDPNDLAMVGLKKHIEEQFQEGWHWKDFTIKWDISALNPMVVVAPYEWDGNIIIERFGDQTVKRPDPRAFTQQQ